ncbi:MAG: hypothetical protein AAFN77_12220 [Planctomycetota bacterium]
MKKIVMSKTTDSKLRRSLCAIGFLIVAALMTLVDLKATSADVIGDQYTLGITGFGDQGGSFLNSQDNFQTLTFDGTGVAKVFGDSVFGEQNAGSPLDEFIIIEQLSTNGLEQEVVIDVLARNKSTQALTNWFADDATTDGGSDPFTESAVEIGAFNGGTNRLTPGPLDGLTSAQFNLIGTDGNAYLDFAIDSPVVNDELGGAAGVFLGSNIGTFDLGGGVEIAGYRLTYVYNLTAIPEPGSTTLLVLVGLAVACRRKRSSLIFR